MKPVAKIGTSIARKAVFWVAIFVCLGTGVGSPPKIVPEGKTADQYYDLGVQYKAMGWTEQARTALEHAIKLGDGNNTSIKAKRYLETKIPRYPAAEEAVSLNIQGFNLDSVATHDQAEKVWLECMRKYPKFEWAYSNLGDLYVQEGKYKEGDALLDQALKINPSYVNAWLHLAESKRKQHDFPAAHKCINTVLKLDPDDDAARLMNAMPDI